MGVSGDFLPEQFCSVPEISENVLSPQERVSTDELSS